MRGPGRRGSVTAVSPSGPQRDSGGAIFRQRREQLGLSVEQLASLVGVSKERLVAIEGGQEAPYLDEHVAIARALGDEPAALVPGAVPQPEKRSAARFRSAGGLHALSPMDMRLLARAAEAGRTCATLFEFVGRDPASLAQWRDVKPVATRPEPWRQGYSLGALARENLSPAHLPLPSVQGLLERFGVHVAFVPFESDQIEAASLYEDRACPVVLLNETRERVGNRLSRRAILAHELCHLMHDGGKRDLLTIVSRHDEEGELVEQRANGFAPSFMVPRGWADMKATDPAELALELGQTWGLSYEGAVWHAKNLELISPEVADGLQKRKRVVRPQDFEETVRRRPHEGEISTLARGLLSDAAIAAFEAGAISHGRLDEILHLS
jgi:Zn-dependent peptidase ImmA (M78 family)/DNA-binding XRE family transcriptional regulator